MSERVEVYWNLTKNCYSIRALAGENKGRVVATPSTVYLEDVTFAVQPAGRAKVLAERRKNVHAFVRGVETPTQKPVYAPYCSPSLALRWSPDRVIPLRPRGKWSIVSYNPYKAGTFVTEDGVPVTRAKFAFCETDTGPDLVRKANILAWNAE